MVSFRSLLSVCSFLLSAHGVLAAAIHPRSHDRGVNALLKKKYTSTDTCGEVTLDASVDVLGLIGISLGGTTVCLCLSQLPTFLSTDAAAEAAVTSEGAAAVTADLTAQVKENGQQCHYPLNSTPLCVSGEPCDFTCVPPFIRGGQSCSMHTGLGAVPLV